MTECSLFSLIDRNHILHLKHDDHIKTLTHSLQKHKINVAYNYIVLLVFVHCSVLCVIVFMSSCSISQLYQCSHCDSDWRRFLYDSLSLCEHIVTVDHMETLTVIISCIFSLDSTDGQSEITDRSTATESRWSSSVTACCKIYEEFRSFSRFL